MDNDLFPFVKKYGDRDGSRIVLEPLEQQKKTRGWLASRFANF